MGSSIRATWRDGDAHFDSLEALRLEYEELLRDGALRVRGEALPPPLEPFLFHLHTPTGPVPLALRGMIVASVEDGVLIQIQGFDRALADHIADFLIYADDPADTADVSALTPSGTHLPLAATAPAPAAPAPASPAPAPASPAPTPASPAPAPSAREWPAPRAHASPTSPAATRAPAFAPGLASVSGGAPPAAHAAHAAATVAPATPSEPAAPAPAAQTTSAPAIDPHSGLTGEIVSPGLDDLAALRALGSAVEPLPADGPTTATRVLAHLARIEATGALALELGADEFLLPVRHGVFHVTDGERGRLCAALSARSGRYRFRAEASVCSCGEAPPVTGAQLCRQVLRARLRQLEPAALERLVPCTCAPRVDRDRLAAAGGLELTTAERRAVERGCDGRRSTSEVCRHSPLGAAAMARLLGFLYLAGALELVEAAAPARAPAAADPLCAERERLAAADPFAALGAHWSDTPVRLTDGLRAARERYGPGTTAAARAPELAARCLALVEAAFQRLATPEARRAHRRTVLQVDVAAAAQLKTEQALLARNRGELEQAIDDARAAVDLEPTAKRAQLLRELMERLARAGDG